MFGPPQEQLTGYDEMSMRWADKTKSNEVQRKERTRETHEAAKWKTW